MNYGFIIDNSKCIGCHACPVTVMYQRADGIVEFDSNVCIGCKVCMQLNVLHRARAWESSDPDTSRIWWEEVGVHQNLTFPVHPDPISGQHCWHQAVRVQCARPGDEAGDIAVDTAKSHRIYQEWLKKTRPASIHSPDRMRRPYWLLRPLKPAKEVYRIPAPVEPASTSRE